jgi:hypothetical protein
LFRRAQPIDFGIGYRWRRAESNLLLSVRLGPGETPTADATASTDTPVPPPKPHHRPKPSPSERPRSGFFWFR